MSDDRHIVAFVLGKRMESGTGQPGRELYGGRVFQTGKEAEEWFNKLKDADPALKGYPMLLSPLRLGSPSGRTRAHGGLLSSGGRQAALIQRILEWTKSVVNKDPLFTTTCIVPGVGALFDFHTTKEAAKDLFLAKAALFTSALYHGDHRVQKLVRRRKRSFHFEIKSMTEGYLSEQLGNFGDTLILLGDGKVVHVDVSNKSVNEKKRWIWTTEARKPGGQSARELVLVSPDKILRLSQDGAILRSREGNLKLEHTKLEYGGRSPVHHMDRRNVSYASYDKDNKLRRTLLFYEGGRLMHMSDRKSSSRKTGTRVRGQARWRSGDWKVNTDGTVSLDLRLSKGRRAKIQLSSERTARQLKGVRTLIKRTLSFTNEPEEAIKLKHLGFHRNPFARLVEMGGRSVTVDRRGTSRRLRRAVDGGSDSMSRVTQHQRRLLCKDRSTSSGVPKKLATGVSVGTALGFAVAGVVCLVQPELIPAMVLAAEATAGAAAAGEAVAGAAGAVVVDEAGAFAIVEEGAEEGAEVSAGQGQQLLEIQDVPDSQIAEADDYEQFCQDTADEDDYHLIYEEDSSEVEVNAEEIQQQFADMDIASEDNMDITDEDNMDIDDDPNVKRNVKRSKMRKKSQAENGVGQKRPSDDAGQDADDEDDDMQFFAAEAKGSAPLAAAGLAVVVGLALLALGVLACAAMRAAVALRRASGGGGAAIEGPESLAVLGGAVAAGLAPAAVAVLVALLALTAATRHRWAGPPASVSHILGAVELCGASATRRRPRV